MKKTALLLSGIALLVLASVAIAGSSRPLGVSNGVITACIETKGNAQTVGDMKLNHCHKGFNKLSWNIKGPRGAKGAKGDTGAAGVAGATGTVGATGPQGIQGPAGVDGTSPVVTRLSGPFVGTNASVATSLDGVQFGPYANGGGTGGSVRYNGANGLTLAGITQLSYTVMHSSSDDSAISAPYLRIFLNGDGDDVIFDATQCATAVPDENVFNTFEVTAGDVRYDDDSCDGVPPDQQSWATVVAAHGDEVISGIYVTTGFAGGADLSAILRTLSVNGQAFTFGVN